MFYFKCLFKSTIFLFCSLICFSTAQAALIAHWPLDGNAQDVSGNGHNGNPVGNITYVPGQKGKGQAARFNGGSWISIPLTNDFKFVNQSLTYSLWVTGVGEYRQTAAMYLNLQGNNYYYFPQISLGKYANDVFMRALYYYRNGSEASSNTSKISDEWTHLAGVVDYPNRLLKLYVNGILSRTVTLSTVNAQGATFLHIGGYQLGGYYYTQKGLIDDVRIYNTALTDTEVKELAIATPIIDAGKDITIEIGDTVNFNGSFKDTDKDGPYTYVQEFGDGNSKVGATNTVSSIPVSYTYMKEGVFTAKLKVTDNYGNEGVGEITVNVVPTVTKDPCDPSVITLRSNLSENTPFGMWDMPFTWDAMRNPGSQDWVLIQEGDTVLLPIAGQVKVKGLCIEEKGVLRSYFNSFSNISHVEISAATIWNKGSILSSNGMTGSVLNGIYKTATDGSNIVIYTNRFLNDTTGVVSARGRGGDDILYPAYQNGAGVLDAFGGDGGNIEIYPVEFINKGKIEAGHGGDADTFDSWDDFVYGNAYGGQGGTVTIFASNLVTSTNTATGTITAGDGGFADGISTWLKHIAVISRRTGDLLALWKRQGEMYHVKGGTGGTVSANLGNISGVLQGSKGKEIHRTLIYPTEYIWVEPTTMTMDETTSFKDAENIVLFGGNDWVMDLRKLSPGAIQADKTITLAVGENSIIDLRGLSDKVFIASEKVEIFADSVLLDEGVTLEDVFDAPVINQHPSKILYHVELGYQKHVIGEPNTDLPIKLNILNNGPTQDIYTIEVESREGWQVSQLPQQVTVNGLRRTELNLRINLPETRGLEDELTVTVTSQGDPTQQAVAHIKVGVEELEAITPRNGQKADISIVLDNSFSMVGYFQIIADALEQMLVQKTVSGTSDDDVKTYFEQFSEENLPTQEDFQAFLDQFKAEESEEPAPVIEFITFTDDVISRVVTDNIPEVIGRIRSLQPKDGEDCPNASVNALSAALENLNLAGQIILATAASPHQDTTAVTQKLYDSGIRTHVLLGGSCEDEANEKLLYQTLAENTGGTFHWLPQGSLSDTTLAETITEVVTQSLIPQQQDGDLKAFGVIKDKFGQPLEGVIVRIGERITATNEEGRWEIDGLSEAQYTLTANKSDYPVVTRTFELGNEQNEKLSLRLASALDVQVKPHTRDNIPQGQELVYTVTIINQGEDTATGVQLQEIVPEGSTLVSMKPLDGGRCDRRTQTCQLPNLAPGGSTQIEIVVGNDQASTLFNRVAVTANEYPDDIQVTQSEIQPYLSVTVSDTPDPVMSEGTVHYTFKVELSTYAPQDATEVVLKILWPESVILDSITTEHGTCETSNFPEILCLLDDLSIETTDSISQLSVNADISLKDSGLLLLAPEVTITSNSYPSYTIVETTNVLMTNQQADVVIVLDSTHSMHEEISAMKTAIQQFIQQVNTIPELTFALIEFKDDVRLRAFTPDADKLLSIVGEIEVKGGGMCPEASAEALDIAVDYVKEKGQILLITDASPYDNADLLALSNKVEAKEVQLTSIISGDCSDGETVWNDIAIELGK